MSGKIFINYRRDDARDMTARVRDRLAAAFGEQNVFMDVENLMAGQRFDRQLEKELGDTDVFLAVIGPAWLDLLARRAESGERDFVREEIAAAIDRGIVVIPVLVQDTPLPRWDTLPAEIRDLVLHQKHSITHERFNRDVEDLVEAIRFARKPATIARGGRSSSWSPAVLTASLVLPLVAAGAGAYYAGVIPAGLPGGARSGPVQQASPASADPAQQASEWLAAFESDVIQGKEARVRAAEAQRQAALAAEREAQRQAALAAEQEALRRAALAAKAEAEARAKAEAERKAALAAAVEAEARAKAEAQRKADLAAADARRRAEAAARAAAAAEAESNRQAALKAEEALRKVEEARRRAEEEALSRSRAEEEFARKQAAAAEEARRREQAAAEDAARRQEAEQQARRKREERLAAATAAAAAAKSAAAATAVARQREREREQEERERRRKQQAAKPPKAKPEVRRVQPAAARRPAPSRPSYGGGGGGGGGGPTITGIR